MSGSLYPMSITCPSPHAKQDPLVPRCRKSPAPLCRNELDLSISTGRPQLALCHRTPVRPFLLTPVIKPMEQHCQCTRLEIVMSHRNTLVRSRDVQSNLVASSPKYNPSEEQQGETDDCAGVCCPRPADVDADGVVMDSTKCRLALVGVAVLPDVGCQCVRDVLEGAAKVL